MNATAAPAAALFPVLYKSVTMVNRETHRGLRLKTMPKPLSFAQGTHLLPAVADEFAAAARELPIVFLPDGDAISPVFLLGLKEGRNSFVTKEGYWSGMYMPAYLRRYPFLMADVEGSEPVLCMDEKFPGLNSGEGQAFFAGDGELSPFLQEAMAFSAKFHAAGRQTQALIARLKALDLFKPVSIDVKNDRIGQASVTGMLVVDEEKLRALPDAVVIELFRTGALPAIYAHLMSLGAVSTLS